MMTLFYELVQVALGQRMILSHTPSEGEWQELFEISQKQAVTGLTFEALDRLSQQEQKPPVDLLYEWIGASEQIKQQNRVVNKRCVEISKQFADAGFRTCILKGQGNALLYPNSLARVSGDIDIWVDASRKIIHEYVVSICPNAQDGGTHVDFPVFDDVIVEVHYRPSHDSRPKYNKRLLQWFMDHADEQFSNRQSLDGYGDVCVPTALFNVVQQMSHIMNHFFVEGIGLRHFVDYYYVLKSLYKDDVDISVIEDILVNIGMKDFAQGVMWIEQHCLGLGDCCLLVEPNEKPGRVILKEMEEGGNFGHHDGRYSFRKKGMLSRGIVDTYRLIKLTPQFPSFSLWYIMEKIKNQWWKI